MRYESSERSYNCNNYIPVSSSPPLKSPRRFIPSLSQNVSPAFSLQPEFALLKSELVSCLKQEQTLAVNLLKKELSDSLVVFRKEMTSAVCMMEANLSDGFKRENRSHLESVKSELVEAIDGVVSKMKLVWPDLKNEIHVALQEGKVDNVKMVDTGVQACVEKCDEFTQMYDARQLHCPCSR